MSTNWRTDGHHLNGALGKDSVIVFKPKENNQTKLPAEVPALPFARSSNVFPQLNMGKGRRKRRSSHNLCVCVSLSLPVSHSLHLPPSACLLLVAKQLLPLSRYTQTQGRIKEIGSVSTNDVAIFSGGLSPERGSHATFKLILV